MFQFLLKSSSAVYHELIKELTWFVVVVLIFKYLLHWQTDQGIKNLDVTEAGKLAGSDPDYSIKDLFEAIATGNSVSGDAHKHTHTTGIHTYFLLSGRGEGICWPGHKKTDLQIIFLFF